MGSNPSQPHMLEEVGERWRSGGREERVFGRHNYLVAYASLYLEQLKMSYHTMPAVTCNVMSLQGRLFKVVSESLRVDFFSGDVVKKLQEGNIAL